MDSESEKESIEGEVESGANWGKAKYDYYYTDYVDQDYPNKLTAKEERYAALEQEEALRIQKKLLSTLDNVDLRAVFRDEERTDEEQDDLIAFLERQNRQIESAAESRKSSDQAKQRKRVKFEDDEEDQDDGEDQDSDQNNESDDEDEKDTTRRRPINISIQKNRGLTPYKKKEYRNPRVKHKLKYKKAMSKRRRNVQEAQVEFHRYSGEKTGIKTTTIKSISLC